MRLWNPLGVRLSLTGKKQLMKKSPPSPLWGHRLPATALALSARRPFRPARFARGLDNDDDRANACRMVLRVFKLNRGHPNTRPTLSGSLTSC